MYGALDQYFFLQFKKKYKKKNQKADGIGLNTGIKI